LNKKAFFLLFTTPWLLSLVECVCRGVCEGLSLVLISSNFTQDGLTLNIPSSLHQCYHHTSLLAKYLPDFGMGKTEGRQSCPSR